MNRILQMSLLMRTLCLKILLIN